MSKKETTLFEAVELLDVIIDGIIASANSTSSEGPTRLLLVRLQRVRCILGGELDRPQKKRNWTLVAILLKEVVRVIGDLVISNIRWILSPPGRGYRGMDFGTRVRSEVLPA